MTAAPPVEYLPDATIDAETDRTLRSLLTVCFTKPRDVVFRDRRYFREPYPNRWVIRDDRGIIVAHVGCHEKRVEMQGRIYPIGGIAEVCVHPDHRRRGYLHAILQRVHAWQTGHGFMFSVLFGLPAIYGSSGYVQVENLVHNDDNGDWKKVTAMVRQLGAVPWPACEVRLPGPPF